MGPDTSPSPLHPPDRDSHPLTPAVQPNNHTHQPSGHGTDRARSKPQPPPLYPPGQHSHPFPQSNSHTHRLTGHGHGIRPSSSPQPLLHTRGLKLTTAGTPANRPGTTWTIKPSSGHNCVRACLPPPLPIQLGPSGDDLSTHTPSNLPRTTRTSHRLNQGNQPYGLNTPFASTPPEAGERHPLLPP